MLRQLTTILIFNKCKDFSAGVQRRILLNCSAQRQHSQDADTDKEVQHHAKIAPDWWNVDGPLRALHSMNTIRVPFIRDGLISQGCVPAKLINKSNVLQLQKVLEVGCGGGILTEQLARLGANVTGIDLGKDVISTALQHLEQQSCELKQRITYKQESVEQHAVERSNYYDAVVLSEVVEHVSDKAALLAGCVQALKPGGSIFITTLNKTVPMYIGGVILGENLLDLAPKGTHHWDKLITPLDLERLLDSFNCHTVLVSGSTYDFWSNSWRWIKTTSMCYALQAVKCETK